MRSDTQRICDLFFSKEKEIENLISAGQSFNQVARKICNGKDHSLRKWCKNFRRDLFERASLNGEKRFQSKGQ